MGTSHSPSESTAPNTVRESSRPTVSYVFGGGGGFGFGFNRGVADGLVDAGIDLFGLPLLGTSAGAITAASLVAGLSFEEVIDEWHRSEDRAGTPWRHDARDLTIPLFGGVDPSRFPADLRTVAVRLPRWYRVVMTTDHYSVADMVAASCAIPPVVQTVVIDGVRYGDGGFVSGTSADLAPDADLLVVISPIAKPIRGLMGSASTWVIRRETKKWTRRTGGRVVHVPPTEAIAERFSPRIADVGRSVRGRMVYELSREYGAEVAAMVRGALGDLTGSASGTQ